MANVWRNNPGNGQTHHQPPEYKKEATIDIDPAPADIDVDEHLRHDCD